MRHALLIAVLLAGCPKKAADPGAGSSEVPQATVAPPLEPAPARVPKEMIGNQLHGEGMAPAPVPASAGSAAAGSGSGSGSGSARAKPPSSPAPAGK